MTDDQREELHQRAAGADAIRPGVLGGVPVEPPPGLRALLHELLDHEREIGRLMAAPLPRMAPPVEPLVRLQEGALVRASTVSFVGCQAVRISDDVDGREGLGLVAALAERLARATQRVPLTEAARRQGSQP